MIDYNKILERDDYARLTSKVKMYAERLAARIRKKMFELDIQDNLIKIDDVTITCQYVGTKSQYPGRRDFLAIESEYLQGLYVSLEDIGLKYYYAGCLDAKIFGCTNKEALRFLNKARNIIEYLAKVEQGQVEYTERVLLNVEDL